MVNLLLSIFIFILVLQLFLFLLAYFFKTDKLTDISYALTFVIVVLFRLFSLPGPGLIQVVLVILICLWGIRLGGYLLIRIHKIGRDKRFDNIRPNFFKFLGFWLLQTLSIWTILLPANIFLSITTDQKLNTLSLFATILFLVFLLVETVADYQKYVFKLDPTNKDKWINTGLWFYSRHPNYFGEIGLWWSVFLFVLPYLSNYQYLSILGPLDITCLILFVSGIPILEKKYDQRYKDNPDYQKYKSQTRLLIPLPLKP